MLAAIPLSLLLLAQTGSVSTSKEELRFGIQVAKKGLWREARFRFEKAVLIDPDNAKALNDLAVALEQAGEFDQARKAYERALELRPGNVYIQQNYDLFREADDKRNRKSQARQRP
jgi:Flp pilus assembly protein TadD